MSDIFLKFKKVKKFYTATDYDGKEGVHEYNFKLRGRHGVICDDVQTLQQLAAKGNVLVGHQGLDDAFRQYPAKWGAIKQWVDQQLGTSIHPLIKESQPMEKRIERAKQER